MTLDIYCYYVFFFFFFFLLCANISENLLSDTNISETTKFTLIFGLNNKKIFLWINSKRQGKRQNYIMAFLLGFFILFEIR